MPIVTVSGNLLKDENNNTLRLRGFNRSGSEYAGQDGWGFFDGPVDQAAINTMKTWKPNVIRVPLNELLWLRLNGVPAAYSGPAYRNEIAAFVKRLRSSGLFVILDLHWTIPGTWGVAHNRYAHHEHSPTFWRSVAKRFKHDRGVIFDLQNEPRASGAWGWSTYKNGCWDGDYWIPGFQVLVDQVRGTGAKNVVMTPGLGYANDVTGWLANRPADPLNQLACSFHTYEDLWQAITPTHWTNQVAPVAAQFPVIGGEFGSSTCTATFPNSFIDWCEANGVHWLAWDWNPFDCASQPALITNYDGTASTYGAAVRTKLLALNP